MGNNSCGVGILRKPPFLGHAGLQTRPESKFGLGLPRRRLAWLAESRRSEPELLRAFFSVTSHANIERPLFSQDGKVNKKLLVKLTCMHILKSTISSLQAPLHGRANEDLAKLRALAPLRRVGQGKTRKSRHKPPAEGVTTGDTSLVSGRTGVVLPAWESA